MPLRDHFHPPWSEQNPWEGFHSAWVNTMVRHLNTDLLPPQYRAIPTVRLGPFVAADIATFEEESLPGFGSASEARPLGNGRHPEQWAAPIATQTLEVDLPAQDAFEVRIHDDRSGMRLVAAIELVSPANKDREDHRQAFVTKCAALLQDQVNLIVVDVVTSRHYNFHHALMRLISPTFSDTNEIQLYAAAYMSQQDNRKWRLESWPIELAIDSALPTVPLWLSSNLNVPLNLERSYEETRQVLRIG